MTKYELSVCQAFDTYNYNFLANKFLKDGELKKIYSAYATSKEWKEANKFKSQLIKTGRKDHLGNEIIHVELYNQKNQLAGKIVPDFEEYPMFAKVFFFHNGFVSKKNILSSSNTILLPTSNQCFVVLENGRHDLEILNNVDDKTELKEKLTGQLYCIGSNRDAPNEQEKQYDKFHKARIQKDLNNMWSSVWDWCEKILEKYKGKSYDELILETKLSDAYLKNSKDSCRITYNYDNKGNVNEIIFQFPYLDNKYYDKEQFYVKVKKNSKGLFEIKNNNKNLNLDNGKIIIPFEGRLLICTQNYSNDIIGGVSDVIYSELFDPFSYNLLSTVNKNKIYCSYLDKNNGYENWVTLKTFEQSYQHSKDLLISSIFLKKYAKGLKY